MHEAPDGEGWPILYFYVRDRSAAEIPDVAHLLRPEAGKLCQCGSCVCQALAVTCREDRFASFYGNGISFFRQLQARVGDFLYSADTDSSAAVDRNFPRDRNQAVRIDSGTYFATAYEDEGHHCHQGAIYLFLHFEFV